MMTPSTPASSRPSWLTLALVLSLGGNLFIGGYLVGHHGDWRDHPPFGGPPHDRPPPGPPNPSFFLKTLAERLPPADADIALEMARVYDRAAEGRAERRRDAHAPLRQALLADPFVPNDLSAAFAAIDAADMASRVELKDALVTLATRLSPEGRRAMAEFRPGPPGPPPGPPRDHGDR